MKPSSKLNWLLGVVVVLLALIFMKQGLLQISFNEELPLVATASDREANSPTHLNQARENKPDRPLGQLIVDFEKWKAWRLNGGHPSMLYQFAHGCSPEEAALLTKYFLRNDSVRSDRQSDFVGLLRRWSSKYPEDAIVALQEVINEPAGTRSGGVFEGLNRRQEFNLPGQLLTQLLAAWAEHDPFAAWHVIFREGLLVDQLAIRRFRKAAVEKVMKIYSSNDPDKAFEILIIGEFSVWRASGMKGFVDGYPEPLSAELAAKFDSIKSEYREWDSESKSYRLIKFTGPGPTFFRRWYRENPLDAIGWYQKRENGLQKEEDFPLEDLLIDIGFSNRSHIPKPDVRMIEKFPKLVAQVVDRSFNTGEVYHLPLLEFATNFPDQEQRFEILRKAAVLALNGPFDPVFVNADSVWGLLPKYRLTSEQIQEIESVLNGDK